MLLEGVSVSVGAPAYSCKGASTGRRTLGDEKPCRRVQKNLYRTATDMMRVMIAERHHVDDALCSHVDIPGSTWPIADKPDITITLTGIHDLLAPNVTS